MALPSLGLSEKLFPELGVISQLLRLLVVIALVVVTARYYTENRVVLAVEALVTGYILFV